MGHSEGVHEPLRDGRAVGVRLPLREDHFELQKRAEIAHFVDVDSGLADEGELARFFDDASDAEGARERLFEGCGIGGRREHEVGVLGTRLVGALVGDQLARSVAELAQLETPVRRVEEGVELAQDRRRSAGEVGGAPARFIESASGSRRALISMLWGIYSRAAIQRSASSAAMQPVPAAVTAWRQTQSWTSPAAKTPSTLVCVVPGVTFR